MEASESSRAYSRVEWVDAAKAIGIILVLLGHAPLPVDMKVFIYAFHMPLFFWLAGLFFKPAGHFTNFAADKALRLLLPYLGFGLLSYVVWLGLRNFSKMAASTPILDPLWGLFYGVGAWLPQNMPLWFLPCLFCSLLLLYAIVRLPVKGALFTLGMSSIIGWLFFQFSGVRLPWSMDVALTAVVFAGTGYLYKDRFLRTAPLPWWVTVALAGWCFGTATLNTEFIAPGNLKMIDMNNGVFGNYFLFYASAASGILLVTNLAKRMQGAVMKFIGQASMTIFALHTLVYLFVTAIGKKVLHIPLEISYEKLVQASPGINVPLVVMMYVLAGLLVPMMVVFLCNRYGKGIAIHLQRRKNVLPEQDLALPKSPA